MHRIVLRAAFVASFVFALPASGACSRPLLQEVAPGVHAIPGRGAAPDRSNCGRSAHGLAIMGAGGVILVDPGPSQREGIALRKSLAVASPHPVVAVILTHAHPENTLAAGAFSGPDTPVLATDLTARLMADRCPRCLGRLKRSVGASGMEGTRIVLPTETVAQSDTRVIGGRSMRLLRFEDAHLAGDLALFDEASGVLFAGGLATGDAIPDLGEGNLAGWRRALKELIALHPRRTIPGRGNLVSPDPLGATLAYLDNLSAFVTGELERGGDLASALERAAMPAYSGWSGYPRRHQLNVQRAWQEMEGEFFLGHD